MSTESSSAAGTLFDLPPELIQAVIQHLPPSSKVCFSAVSKDSYEHCQTSKGWLKPKTTVHDWLQPTSSHSWTRLAIDVENKSASFLGQVQTLSLVALPSHAVTRLMHRLSIADSGGTVLKNATKFQVTGTAIKQLADAWNADSELFTASSYHEVTEFISQMAVPWSERKHAITDEHFDGRTIIQCSLAADSQVRFLQRMLVPQHYCVDWQDLEEMAPCEGQMQANSKVSASAGNIVDFTKFNIIPLSITFHGMVVPWTNAHDPRTHACPSTSFLGLSRLKQMLVSDTIPEPDIATVAEALSRFAKPYSVHPTVALHNTNTDEISSLKSKVQALLSAERKGRHLIVQLAQDVPSCHVCGSK
jgi:hypothetical protein